MVDVVGIEWMDACYYFDGHEPTVPIPMITFGFLLEDTPDRMTVAAEIHGDNVTRHHITVPKRGSGMSPKIHRIGKMRVPQSILKYRKEHGL